VIVHHGPGRTKGDLTLASYDLVLTTYAIVSLETPLPGVSGAESQSGPLSRIQWHRIVLDEAQAIKNGRTRVARACWALRGKRRWCLSGTPVQNHVSDLWSVFRFLRYRPFDDPRAFREHVLDAMREDQSNGYDRLRVILTQVALRRTKSTKINGEPVVRLPKRIDHVEQLELGETERQCYEALECESLAEMEAIDARAHMTMQSNTGEPTRYAHALRMLLRLRQACDDMSLVRGGSPQFLACRTKAIAAGHAALPRGQAPALATAPPGESTPPRMVAVDAAGRARLLSLIEGGEAECPVCHDAVEDPVVSFSCRHVFCSECASTQLAEASGRDDDECWLCPAFGCGKPIRPQDILSRAQLCDGAMDAVGTPGAAPEATNGLSAQSLSAPSVGASRPAVLGSHCSTKVRAVLTYMDTSQPSVRLASCSRKRRCAAERSARKRHTRQVYGNVAR